VILANDKAEYFPHADWTANAANGLSGKSGAYPVRGPQLHSRTIASAEFPVFTTGRERHGCILLAGRIHHSRGVSRMTLDPIHQFNINNLFTIGHIGGRAIAFTNSSLYMLIVVAIICLVSVRGFAGKQLVPGRFQSLAELSYVFVANMIRSNAGAEGMKFFTLIYSLFMFVLVANVISIIPYSFAITSHIIITAAFALLVFFTVIIYGFYRNGAEILRDLCATGRTDLHSAAGRHHRNYLLPVAAAVAQRALIREHTRRPYHAEGLRRIRRHARSLGVVGWIGGIVPLAMTVALTALELLIAFLQAYVFAVLAVIYLNDAIHPRH
jgi:F-type H+-transporting ATPase subunit a